MPLRVESGFPGLIRPMPASSGRLPPGPGWAFEFRWDGVRTMTRNDLEVSGTYPEVRALSALPGDREAVLDGRSLLDVPYAERRQEPAALGLGGRQPGGGRRSSTLCPPTAPVTRGGRG